MKIAVILPSRGLIFSRTAEEILNNLEGYMYDIYFAHGLSIPECFNEPLSRALANNSYTHYWFVEDDMIIPEDSLSAMVLMDAPVVTMDYPVSKKGQGAVFKDKAQRVIFTGTGCLLVKREVFDRLSKPYFRTDIKWGATNHGQFIRFRANENTMTGVYGLHDVTFGVKLWQAEIPISVAGTIGQRKLLSLGKSGSNDGAHKIEEWYKVTPDYLYKSLKKNEVISVGELTTVLTPTGEVTLHPNHAKKLVKVGLATKMPKQSIVIDFNGIDL